MIKYILFIILFVITIVFAQDIYNGTINVVVEDLRNNKGYVKVGLYNSEKGFPDTPKFAYSIRISTITDNQSIISFNNIPFGNYAVGITHDENRDGEFNTNFFKIPKEGFYSGLICPDQFSVFLRWSGVQLRTA